MDARGRDAVLRQPFMLLIGATLERAEPGEVEIRLPCRPDLMQHTGVVHAGVVTSIVDTACGAAAATLMPEGRNVVSVEFKINLLAPAAGDFLRAIGRVVRAGRTLIVCSGEVFAVDGETSRIIAMMQATMMAVTTRGSLQPEN
jgi:uncharacterized protein (TIGR00369 family)